MQRDFWKIVTCLGQLEMMSWQWLSRWPMSWMNLGKTWRQTSPRVSGIHGMPTGYGSICAIRKGVFFFVCVTWRMTLIVLLVTSDKRLSRE